MTAQANALQARCLWWSTIDGGLVPRERLRGHVDADVCIVGAGFTGLWAALAILEAEPSCRVVVLEAELAGFGASGRNGGWASALFPIEDHALVRSFGLEATRSLRRQLEAEVDRIIAFAEAEGIDADVAKGGTVTVARNAAQAARLRASVEEASTLGIDGDLRWLDAAEASRRLQAEGVLGGTFTPHCAAINPAKLARGLAEAVERRGGTVFERSRVNAIDPARDGAPAEVRTARGLVRSPVVLRATEAWTPTLEGHRRDLVPIYSLVVASEPLDPRDLEPVGLGERETFADGRNLIVYGQRTADHRLVFGGRGAPYHFGSRVSPGYDLVPEVFEALEDALRDLLPQLPRRLSFTHRWGGPLGVPRDWMPSVGFEPATGMAWSGGYVGDGVVLSSLAARACADLVLGRETERTTLPFVGHRHPRWEPEPLRFLGVNAGRIAAERIDRAEAKGRRSPVSSAIMRLVGRSGHVLTP